MSRLWTAIWTKTFGIQNGSPTHLTTVLNINLLWMENVRCSVHLSVLQVVQWLELLNRINDHAVFVIALVFKHRMSDILRPHKIVLGLSSILDKLQWERPQLLGTYPDLLLHLQTGLYLHDFTLQLLHMRSSLFWDFIQHRWIVNYQSSYFISMLITVGQVQKSGMFVAFQFSDFREYGPLYVY